MRHLSFVSVKPTVSDPKARDHFLDSQIAAIIGLWGWG